MIKGILSINFADYFFPLFNFQNSLDITYLSGLTNSFIFLNGLNTIKCARFEAIYSTTSSSIITAPN